MSARDRYAEALTPERAETIRRERLESVSAAIAWAAIALVLASFVPHLGGF